MVSNVRRRSGIFSGTQPRRVCGATGSRTPGLFNAIEALFQLSYSPMSEMWRVEGAVYRRPPSSPRLAVGGISENRPPRRRRWPGVRSPPPLWGATLRLVVHAEGFEPPQNPGCKPSALPLSYACMVEGCGIEPQPVVTGSCVPNWIDTLPSPDSPHMGASMSCTTSWIPHPATVPVPGSSSGPSAACGARRC